MKNDFKRYNTRFNYDYNMFNNVKVGARFDGSWSELLIVVMPMVLQTTIPAIPEVVICNMRLRV